jgi:RHS repeat-associated protein
VASRTVGGAVATFTYDDDGLLTQAGDITINRNPASGQLSGTALATLTTARTYNSFGELASLSAADGATELFATQYIQDKLGRITQKTETVEGVTNVYDYTYLHGRLVRVDKNLTLLEEYSYDANGNRYPLDNTYDAQDRLISTLTASYGYDANGDLFSKTDAAEVTEYSYDAMGNLVQVVMPDASQIDYLIDGRNRRVAKQVNGVTVQSFLYKDQLNPVQMTDAAGQTSRFIYGSRANVPDYVVKGGATYRIISDHLGSPRLVVDTATGTIVQQMDYDAFGNVIQDTNPGFQPFGFAGGIYDTDTGLVRFGARDYDPQIGRWTTKDPIKFDGGDANLYGYALGDPVNLVDLNGMLSSDCSDNTPNTPTASPQEPSFIDNVFRDFSATNSSLLGTGLRIGSGIVLNTGFSPLFGVNASVPGLLAAQGVEVIGVAGAMVANTTLATAALQTGIIIGSTVNSIPVIGGGTVGDWWVNAALHHF